MSRTKKQPYRGSRRFDKTCRCHGSCSYCTNNRLIQQAREELRIRQHLAARRLPAAVGWV